MNIRGLTELGLLTVGFQIGLLSLGTAPATRQEDVSPVRYQESR